MILQVKPQIKPQIFDDSPCPIFTRLKSKTCCFDFLFLEGLKTSKISALKFVDIFGERQKVNVKNLKLISFTISTISADKIAELSNAYRNKNKPTNVLSFEGKIYKNNKKGATLNLGDIYICPSVIRQEAIEQAKNPQQHYMHMLLHGFLHLLGFDHETEKDAQKMEKTETETLAKFCIENPY